MNAFDPYFQWLGIPPQEQPADYYRLLGLRRFEADPFVIQSATEERMVVVRTYQTGPRAPYTQKLLNELASAKLCLLDPYSKAEYDAALAASIGNSAHAADDLLPAAVQNNSAAAGSAIAPVQPNLPKVVALDDRLGDEVSSRLPMVVFMVLLVVFGIVTGIWIATEIRNRQEIPQARPSAPLEQPEHTANAAGSVEAEKTDSPGSSTVIMQEASGFIVFPLSVAMLSGSVAVESRDVGDFLVGWKSEDDEAAWQFKVVRLPSQGIFRVRIAYFAPRSISNAQYILAIDDEEQIHDIRAYDRVMEDEFYIAIKGAGEHRLGFYLRNLPSEESTFGLKMIEFSMPRRP